MLCADVSLQQSLTRRRRVVSNRVCKLRYCVRPLLLVDGEGGCCGWEMCRTWVIWQRICSGNVKDCSHFEDVHKYY